MQQQEDRSTLQNGEQSALRKARESIPKSYNYILIPERRSQIIQNVQPRIVEKPSRISEIVSSFKNLFSFLYNLFALLFGFMYSFTVGMFGLAKQFFWFIIRTISRSWKKGELWFLLFVTCFIIFCLFFHQSLVSTFLVPVFKMHIGISKTLMSNYSMPEGLETMIDQDSIY